MGHPRPATRGDGISPDHQHLPLRESPCRGVPRDARPVRCALAA